MNNGNRKYRLGQLYLVGCFGMGIIAALKGQVGWDALGLAAIPTSIAAGLGVIIWGNVQEHRAKNGHGAT